MINVLAVDFRPRGIEKWYSTRGLIYDYIEDMRDLSGGIIDYRVVELFTSERFPVLDAPKQYDAVSFNRATIDDSSSIQVAGQYPMMLYEWFLDAFDILEPVKFGKFDEVWMFGGPRMGFYESRMVGRTSYWCNAPKLRCNSKDFVIMGFNYERDVRQMLHSFCHRVESILGKKFNAMNFTRRIYARQPVRTWLLREYPKWLVENGTAHHSHIGAPSYSQDEYKWLGALKPRWWKILKGT